MSAKVRQIKDKDGTKIYPVTKAGACFMPNGKDTVERILNDEIDQDTDITFPDATKIVKTLASGSTVITEFLDDGSIKETTKDEHDVVLQIKVTKFNEDGSISIDIDPEDEDEEDENDG